MGPYRWKIPETCYTAAVHLLHFYEEQALLSLAARMACRVAVSYPFRSVGQLALPFTPAYTTVVCA